MATNLFMGQEATVGLAATSSGTITQFGAVRNWRITVNRTIASIAHRDSSGWELTSPGSASWTLTADAAYLSTSASTNEQDTIRTALTAKTRKYWQVKNSTGTGSQTFAGYGYAESFDISGDFNDHQMHNFSIRGDGALSES